MGRLMKTRSRKSTLILADYRTSGKSAKPAARFSCQIEQQNLSVLHTLDVHLTFVGYGSAVALTQLMTVQLHRALRHLHPGGTALAEFMPNLLVRFEQGDVEVRVLMDRDRSIAPIRRCDYPQLALLFIRWKRLLLITRFVARLVGHDPDLQQMHR